MNGDADVLGAALLASEERHEIIVHRSMVRTELDLERFKIKVGTLSITNRIVAVHSNPLATVNALLDGAHRFFLARITCTLALTPLSAISES